SFFSLAAGNVAGDLESWPSVAKGNAASIDAARIGASFIGDSFGSSVPASAGMDAPENVHRSARVLAALSSLSMARTRIKICGIRTLDAAMAAVDSGADAVGFMFVRSSVRFVEPEEAAAIMWALPPLMTTVGVYMNASVDTFADIEAICPTH